MRHCQKVGKSAENQPWTTDHRSAQPSKITPKIAAFMEVKMEENARVN